MTASLHPDDHARIVMLTFGRLEHGGHYWCYVAVKPSEYERFQQATKSGGLMLQTFEQDGYGEVIVSGDGTQPPADITRMVAKMFDVPIKDLHADVDPQAVIAGKLQEMQGKKE